MLQYYYQFKFNETSARFEKLENSLQEKFFSKDFDLIKKGKNKIKYNIEKRGSRFSYTVSN